LAYRFDTPIRKLPKYLKSLAIYGTGLAIQCNLPESLIYLVLGDGVDFEEVLSRNVYLTKLPVNLKKLECNLETYRFYSERRNENIDEIFPCLTDLVILDYPKSPVTLPSTIETLKYGYEAFNYCTNLLFQNFNEYITSWECRYTENQKTWTWIYPAIHFNDKWILLDEPFEDEYQILLFEDKQSKVTTKHSFYTTTYEECESFLLEGYNIKSARSR
jgi:hypothetical protein